MSQNFPKETNKYTFQVDSEFQLEVYVWKNFWKRKEGLLLLAIINYMINEGSVMLEQEKELAEKE